MYEITPEGLKPTIEVPHGQSIRKTTGRRLDRAIIAVLALALIYFVIDKFWLSSHILTDNRTAPIAGVGARSIEVPPFADMSEKKDQEYFEDGLAEELVDLLAQIPDLKVIGCTSSFQCKGRPKT